MGRGDKDGLPTDSVHVDAGARFEVIQMDVAIFCDQENHVVLFTYLQGERWGAKINRDSPFKVLHHVLWSIVYTLHQGTELQ